ncbi:isochorismate synthase [Prevotella sp. 10(H)]|uniref:isochorismate synthase n=1 Tax=Prevotella sp. 10(H) TaxID=1158294 RepID=UPI0009DDC6A8|nr:isochorismate synthase [Prevotella sp. 10(H)]
MSLGFEMELTPDIDYSIFDSLIDNNIRFAVYRQAWQKEINLILQTSHDTVQPSTLKDLNSRKGFVIAPFHISKQTPVILIHPDVQIKGESKILKYLSENDFQQNISDIDLRNQSSVNSFEQYSTDYQIFYSSLIMGKQQKLVLSRTYDVKRSKDFSAGMSFRKACSGYDSNFVFLCNTPETGTWMGVSPELLVSEQADVYKTVALAGTKNLSTENWDDKNRKEQQIVVDYMQQQLSRVGDDIVVRGPFTAQAGDIEHLKTKFSFHLKYNYKIGDLLDLLHPSPAVCGFPKEEAFDFIFKNESYDRRYYSGFVGPLDIEGSSRLYVNLRCMQIGKDLLRLYAGGGILPSSELKSEWEETENKLQTILSVI